MSIVSTVYGVADMHDTPYRTKIQLPFGWRLHKFHRADEDRAWHDHPNHFWTLPFADYDEERLYPNASGTFFVHRRTVKAWTWHYRPATYTHRLLGRADGQTKPHWTLVREILPEFREWGFYVEQEGGAFKRIPWREYLKINTPAARVTLAWREREPETVRVVTTRWQKWWAVFALGWGVTDPRRVRTVEVDQTTVDQLGATGVASALEALLKDAGF